MTTPAKTSDACVAFVCFSGGVVVVIVRVRADTYNILITEEKHFIDRKSVV